MSEPKLVRVTWSGSDGQTYSVALDACTSQVHTYTNTVTEHPVEDGANMSDHIRPDLNVLSIEGIITNTPLTLLPEKGQPLDHTAGAREIQVKVDAVAKSVRIPLPIVGSLVGNIPIQPVPQGTVKGFSPAFNRVGLCYEALLKLRNDGVLCRVITHLATHEQMAIRSLTVSATPETGHALPVSMDFIQVRIGSTEEVPIPIIPTERAEKGSTTPKPPPSEAVGDDASTLYNAVKG